MDLETASHGNLEGYDLAQGMATDLETLLHCYLDGYDLKQSMATDLETLSHSQSLALSNGWQLSLIHI